ncbi:terminase small subunit [Marinobacter sp.]|uniref:terminase small subunit n=1 Tax=Marinobacter sp. TaxID=50741 RepID=UPI003A91D47B
MPLSDNPRASTKAKLREFADLYRGGPSDVRGNATQCYQALHPGAKGKAATVNATEYLNHPYTQEYLRAQTDAVAESADIRQERVLKEIASIALFDPRKLFDDAGHPKKISELDDATAAAISGLKVTHIGAKGQEVGAVVEYKLSDKNSALEKLMKHLGLYEQDNKQKNESLADALLAGIRRVKGLDE